MRGLRQRDAIRGVAEQWKRQYPSQAKIYRLLRALDVETATGEDVSAIIGNDTWVTFRCDECGRRFADGVQVGEAAEYEIQLCFDCCGMISALVADFGQDSGSSEAAHKQQATPRPGQCPQCGGHLSHEVVEGSPSRLGRCKAHGWQTPQVAEGAPVLGMCTHCSKAPATEVHHAGLARLCPTCAALRKGEDWALPTGLAQEGENCERFQGTDQKDSA